MEPFELCSLLHFGNAAYTLAITQFLFDTVCPNGLSVDKTLLSRLGWRCDFVASLIQLTWKTDTLIGLCECHQSLLVFFGFELFAIVHYIYASRNGLCLFLPGRAC